MHDDVNLGAFLSTKRREKGITSLRMAETAGISPGYYCDIEKNRKAPPDRAIIDRIIAALGLSAGDKMTCYDLAGKARAGVSPDLPDYIMANEVVRAALRVAKEKATTDDWQQFIDKLERKAGK